MSLLSQLLDRVTALPAAVSDTARRLRYQRSALRGLATGRTIPADPQQRDASSRWTPPLRLGGSSHVALECRANTHVAYDVTLPAGATVVSWLAVLSRASQPALPTIEFHIHVEAGGAESTARCVVDARRQGRWHVLRVRAPAAGAARIALSATSGDATQLSADTHPALWGEPSIEVPRSAANFVRLLRAGLPGPGLLIRWSRAPATEEEVYASGIRQTRPSRRALSAQRQWSRGQSHTLSLVTFVPSPAGWPGERTAESLNSQSYPHWEWIVAATEDAIEQGRDDVARLTGDRRVRILPVPARTTRAQAWNSAWRGATGEFAAVLGANDALSPSALYEMAKAMGTRRVLICSTRTRSHRGAAGTGRSRSSSRTGRELLLARNYIGRLAMIDGRRRGS